jgi:hypothetical protein
MHVATFIRVDSDVMRAKAPDPILCQEQSLGDAVRELKKRLLGVAPKGFLRILLPIVFVMMLLLLLVVVVLVLLF